MKKRSILLVNTLIMATVLAACGNGGNGDNGGNKGAEATSGESEAPKGKSISIEYFNQKSEEAAKRAFQNAADAFHKENPDITVKITTVPDSEKVLTARLSTGDVPTAFHDKPTSPAFFERAAQGFYLDLTEQPFMERIIPSIVESVKSKEDGKVYAMPYTQNFMGIYYNIDIFEKNNEQVPKTWDELIALAKRFKDKGIQPFEQAYKDTGYAGHFNNGAMAALFPEGALYLAEASKDAGKKPSDSPDFRKFAERVTDILDYANADVFSIPTPQAQEKFANGEAAMMIFGSYARGTIMLANPNLRLGAFPIPGFAEDSGLVLAGVDASLVVSGKASKEEQEAALKWLDFLSRTENAQAFSDLEGAPSAVSSAIYGEENGTKVLMDRIKAGKVREWRSYMGSEFSLSEPFQGLLMDRDVDAFLANADEVFKNGHAIKK